MEPIATLTMTNVSGLGIYDIKGDEALVGINNEALQWVDIEYDKDGELYIDFYGKHYLGDFMANNNQSK